MVKTNLPVILLKGLVLLPSQEVRIEINNDISKKVVDISKLYHNDEVLIVCPLDTLEENPDTSDLPRIGVVGKVKSKIDLPNGNSRIVITGEKRVKVYSYVNYSNEEDVLESIVSPLNIRENDEVENTAVLRKLMEELDNYIKINPFISNSILSSIKGITDLDKLTDKIGSFLPLSFEKKLQLMLDASPLSRAKYLISEIGIEIAVLELEEKIELELKHNLDNSQKEYILKEKIKLIQEELGERSNKTDEIENFKNKLIEINAPKSVVDKVNEELKRYELTPEVSPEVSVIRNYVDTLLNIPWSNKTKDEKNLKKIEKNLDKNHYALTDAKTRIIEYIALKNFKKNVLPPTLCLIGPPGVGKTTFAKSVADALNKNFVKISLGGLFDSAEIIGHRKTYIGSGPGKIINALIKAKSNNPVILLDEIDKLSRDYRGDPSSTLLDILDSTQNKHFVDNYVDEEVDLSDVLFIVTANNKYDIPFPLYDRMEVIELSGYTDYEKLDIAKNHIIPKIYEKYNLNKKNITIEDNAILSMIESYTKESGVRELDRLINKLFRKIITEYQKLNKKINNVVVKEDKIGEYLGKEKILKPIKRKSRIGFINALAYTNLGGDIIECEITSFSGNNKEILTGSLGDVMKESVSIAISYIKSHSKEFNINLKDLEKKDFHINFRGGGIPKDGPSAGTTITTLILSYLTNKKIDTSVSMTGEMTLLGDVLPIGGLKEKAVAAYKHGIRTVFIPEENKKDLNDVSEEIRKNIKFICVKNYTEIYQYLFDKNTKK